MAQDQKRLSGLAAVQRAERRVTSFIWGFRVAVSLLTVGGLAVVFVIHSDDPPLHFGLTAVAFLTPLSVGLVMAAITRIMHVNLERRLRAQLAARSIQLQDVAMRDELTQLFNRRYFYERLQRELEEAQDLGHSLGVVLLDVDGLKGINDTFGHKVGDEVLAAVGRMLVEQTRACDVPARVGGDEFAVLMLDADKSGMYTAVKRLQDALDDAGVYENNGASLKLRVSMGASGYPWGGENVDEIVRAADSKLYAMKAMRHRERAAAKSGASA
jgi:diguanylate cyclase (GGDEF)-like protein